MYLTPKLFQLPASQAVQNQTSRQEAVAGATHLPTSLPSLTNPNHYSNQQHSNYYVSKHYLKSFPYNNGYLISTNPQVPYPSQGHYPAGVAGPTMKRSMAASMGAGINQNGAAAMQQQQQPQYLPPLAARNPNSQTPNPNGAALPPALQQQPNAHSDAWSKPRLITIVRATDRPRKKITILLNRKALHNYEQFICDVSEAFGLPQWKNDKIRKLVTVRGRKVQGISDFFRDDDVFIGVSGKEPLKRDLVSDLLGEIYPDEGDYVQALCKEWDAARSRNRANKQHQQQQQNRNVSLDPNSHKDAASNNNMSISEEHLAAGENHNINGKKSKYIVEFDENGRRKRKKKVAAAENDILLEMEVQRQRERLKLMELERKKREQQQQQQGNNNSTNTNATTRLNEKDQNQQQQKPHHQKRVNIVTPSGGENQQQQQQQQQQSEEKTTKIKRRPKLKKPSTNQTNDENVNTESRLHQNDEAKKEAVVENNNNESSPRHQAASRNANAAPTHKASKSPGPPKSDDTSSSPRAANHNNRNTSPQKEPHKQGGGKTPVQHHSPSKLKRQISNTSYVTDKYELIKTLGDGNFAVVKQARLKGTDHEYAIKVIDKSKMKGKEHMIDNEIYIMRSCNHPNIVKFHEAFETKEEVYLITDLVKGGDLFDAITQSVKFNERDSSIMVQDVCEALFYLHSKNIVHRDLKPENLLVMRKKDDRINIKLADFGLAMEVKEPIYTVCGTPTYVAPEILSEIGYGLEVDMWACGVITYILLCGFPPFRSLDRNQEELFQYIQNGEYEYLMPYWEGISDSSKDLIDHLLVVDIKKRWRAEDVLTHPWIVSQGNTKPLPANFDEHKKEMLKDLKAKASVFSAEPWATK